MKKTVFTSEIKQVKNSTHSVPYIKYMGGKWRQDNWYIEIISDNSLKEFEKQRKKEGWLIK